MSTLKVNKLRDTAGSADAITLDPNGGAVLAGVTTVTSVKVGAAVTISESGIEASGIGITCANINGTQIGGRRNKIINGAMQVAQRGTSSTDISSTGYLTVDRFALFMGNTDGRVTMSQVADVHDGFANALKYECTTADTSIAASENLGIKTLLEGQDLQQIQKGSSGAKQLTLSFYVKGNANATYTCELNDKDNDRVNGQTFNVTTSWSRVTLTFAADTTGAFDDDNAVSLQVNWWLHAGSTYTGGTFSSNTWASRVQNNRVNSSQTSFLDSTSRTFFITGVQLEVGSVATDFEHRSFGQELTLCQRYFFNITGDNNYRSGILGYANSSSEFRGAVNFPNPMRANPTFTGSATAMVVDSADDSASFNVNTISSGVANTGALAIRAYIEVSTSSMTAGQCGQLEFRAANGFMNFSAEL